MFGALIPKGGYLNVSLLGEKLQLESVQEFINAQRLTVPPAGDHPSQNGGLCGCTPRIAVRPARGYFGAHWVAVGDASVVRLYKDGIGSAYYTAQRAMATAVERGIARADFAATYAPFCRSIARDNLYGRLLFRIWSLTLRSPELLRAWIYAIRRESALPPAQRIHQRILWGMFTGEESYRTLFWLAVSPKAGSEVLRGWGKLL
jgi:hypothetical protein